MFPALTLCMHLRRGGSGRPFLPPRSLMGAAAAAAPWSKGPKGPSKECKYRMPITSSRVASAPSMPSRWGRTERAAGSRRAEGAGLSGWPQARRPPHAEPRGWPESAAVVDRARRSATRRRGWRRIWSNAISLRKPPTSSGWPTLPTSRPGRGSSTSQSFSTLQPPHRRLVHE